MTKLLTKTNTNADTLCFRVRSKLGISQVAIANKIGVSLRSVKNWESGRVKPSGAARKVLTDLLN